MSTGSALEPLSPAERASCVAAARMHYLEDRSKTDIAEALGVSRFKVARLIELARQHGIVRIQIDDDSCVDLDLSERLRSELGLQRAVVATGDVALAAADLLPQLLSDGDVLGLPWSRTIARMVEQVHDLPVVDVVQLTGAHQSPGIDTSAVAIARAVARVSGGRSTLFFAPFVAEDAEAAATFARQPEVRAARAQLRRVTHALVAAGAWQEGSSTVHDAISPTARRQAARQGVVGEVAGVLLDAQGRAVASATYDRLVTLSLRDLERIPHVVLLAAGAEKAQVVRAAVAGGFPEALVCDRALAQALLTT
ncbi:hypothetical protein M3697_10525 [Janibacter melonis]|uniref:sugar-binding transcriptional regulator n=1 Tax=Janibacter melonis TaxID=262209 RepID=UPI002042DF02|nr:sugar-binding domain-containing protein [Janibacter melonis]MCM3555537.1 hypothetical protein [Janibacter melonis]